MEPLINPKKKMLSAFCRFSGLRFLLHAQTYLRHGNNFIRVVNLHSVPLETAKTFEEQLQFFQKHYDSVTIKDLKRFVGNKGKWHKSKPGLIISFDDGLYNNYSVAKGLLEKYGFVGWFFVAPGFCDTPPKEQSEYSEKNSITKATQLEDGRLSLNWDEVKDLSKNHVIGCHTYNHCRFYKDLSLEKMALEIIKSKQILEDKLGSEIESFCWVGGETNTYNEDAMKLILKGGYKFCFTTIPLAITSTTNTFLLGRSNIESNWPLEIVKFQLCGAMDWLYFRKRIQVHKILKRALNLSDKA